MLSIALLSFYQGRDANKLGQAVLEELRKRCDKGRAKPREGPEQALDTLIILDNVSEPELLSAAQLAKLPYLANCLRLVATTRLGPERLARSSKQLATVPVDFPFPFSSFPLLSLPFPCPKIRVQLTFDRFLKRD
jgi:hypothetical protein